MNNEIILAQDIFHKVKDYIAKRILCKVDGVD